MLDFLGAYLLNPITLVVWIFGLVFGSFANVCIFRIPRKEFWSHHRSYCPYCAQPIPIWWNIPLVSYLVLRGRSHCCQQKISWVYPVVELSWSLLWVALYWRYPFVLQFERIYSVDSGAMLQFLLMSFLFYIVFICSVIDFQHLIIPDVLSLPLILLIPLVVWLSPALHWQQALIGAVAGGGLLYGIAWVYWLLRKEIGMGFGDVKLLTALGGWLGYESIAPTLLMGSILGTVFALLWMVKERNFSMRVKIPFGPFLAMGALCHVFWGPELLLKVFS